MLTYWQTRKRQDLRLTTFHIKRWSSRTKICVRYYFIQWMGRVQLDFRIHDSHIDFPWGRRARPSSLTALRQLDPATQNRSLLEPNCVPVLYLSCKCSIWRWTLPGVLADELMELRVWARK